MIGHEDVKKDKETEEKKKKEEIHQLVWFVESKIKESLQLSRKKK